MRERRCPGRSRPTWLAPATMPAAPLPGTTLTASCSTCGREVSASFDDARSRHGLLAAIDRTAIVRTPRRGGPTGRLADSADLLGVRPGGGSKKVAYDAAPRRPSSSAGGWTKSGGRWRAPRAKAPFVRSTCSRPMPTRTRRERRRAARSKPPGRTIGLEVDRSPSSRRRIRGPASAAAIRRRRGGPQHRPGPRLYPLLASQPGPLAGGCNISGFQDAALDKALARPALPGTPADGRRRWPSSSASWPSELPILPLVFRDDSTGPRTALTGTRRRARRRGRQRFWDVVTWRLAER